MTQGWQKRTKAQRNSERNNSGQTIVEYNLCFFLLVFSAALPTLNLVLMSVAIFGLQIAVDARASEIALTEKKAEAAKLAASTVDHLKDSPLRLFHYLEGIKTSAPGLEVIVRNFQENSVYAVPITDYHKLPGSPGRNLHISYKLLVPVRIYPLFNLSGLPLVGQIPCLAKAVDIQISSEKPVEYMPGLDF